MRMSKKYFIGPLFFLLLAGTAQAALMTNTQRTILTSGLVGWWTMDGASCGLTYCLDKSGSGKTGAFSGSPTPRVSSGKIGQGLKFNGTSSYVNTGNLGTAIAGDFTVNAWVNPRVYVVSHSIMGRYEVHPGFALYQGDGAATNGTYIFETSNAEEAITYQRASTTVPIGTWGMVTAVRAGSTCTIYINGQVSTGTLASGSCSSASFNNGGSTVVGARHTSAVASPYIFDGNLDDIRMYNRALSAAEVLRLYQIGSTKLQSQVTKTNSVTTNLVGHWTFDGDKTVASAGLFTFIDRGSAGKNATTSTQTVGPGRFGQALFFSPSVGTKYASVAGDGALNITGPLTVSVWLNSQKAGGYFIQKYGAAGGVTTKQYIIGLSATGASITVSCGDFSCSPCNINGDCGASCASPSGNVIGKWHHVVGVYDGSKVYCYFDGVKGSEADAPTALTNVNTPLEFGRWRGSAAESFEGSMDDVRVYSGVLTASQVTTLYRTGALGTQAQTTQVGRATSGLIGHWSFNAKDIYSTTAYDRSGQGNNGTITNSGVVTGKVGQALTFNGASTRVAMANGIYDAQTTGTITAWVKPKTTDLGTIISAVGTDWFAFFVERSGSTFRPRVQCNCAGVGNVVVSDAFFTADTWHHVAVTSTGSTWNLFIDGTAQALTVSGGTNNGKWFDDAGGTVTYEIGRRVGGAGDNALEGSMDEVRVYDKVLTTNEIAQLYKLGK